MFVSLWLYSRVGIVCAGSIFCSGKLEKIMKFGSFSVFQAFGSDFSETRKWFLQGLVSFRFVAVPVYGNEC